MAKIAMSESARGYCKIWLNIVMAPLKTQGHIPLIYVIVIFEKRSHFLN
jgi:hypothetical protein